MFSTFKQRLLLGIYIFIVLSIPVGAYLVAEYQTTIKSSASEQKKTKLPLQVPPKTTTSPAKELLDTTDLLASPEPSTSDTPTSSSPTIATAFGPTLSFKATLEGRPAENQAGKVFVGIAEGTLTTNPKFILSFTVDLPASGEYSNLSLAGLSTGSTYTALIKGSAQIAASQIFTMSPTVTNLNDGQPITLTSGDLNEDNTINSADYAIVQKALSSTTGSANWNENADLNKDGIVNTFDLGIVAKNMGKTGASGIWTSPIPKTATTSAALTPTPVGGPENDSGYWIWIPK